MPFDNLLVDRDGAVVVITINRPRVLNALNTQTLDELRRVVLDLKQDDGVRAIIVTGAGTRRSSPAPTSTSSRSCRRPPAASMPSPDSTSST